ncbi:hypothetical protein, variant 1 [Verruconis gallopava]|uniref:Phytase A n=1 Tax=Verruconis gallopava TaxID=253628 RepID=A0A0D1XDZ2_9PEZI|nr:hypothetical protein, variant 1 [Verruconis gallopava]KIW00411.1 hypothetical protein, variant 1 [Verruconis gallopava]
MVIPLLSDQGSNDLSSADYYRRASTVLFSGCDNVQQGFQCSPEISHLWGQYSPFFSVPSSAPDDIPCQCKVTFANVLSRHGARDPTASKTTIYSHLVGNLTANVTSFVGKYAFLVDYKYTLGADLLTELGRQQMVNSGVKFYERYKHLAVGTTPFVRAASEQRVVDSASNFTLGFHQALNSDNSGAHDDYPYPIIVIPEAPGSNNTLSHGLCTAFEDGPASDTGKDAQSQWMDVFVPPIQKRLQEDLPGAQFTKEDVIFFMDLCPFETVASPVGSISPICHLFTRREWQQYDYYETLGKWYGFGPGNYFGATNGVGFVNELLARMTQSPVNDHTSTNTTLDSDPVTFPLDEKHTLYADFTHDNDMTSILAALGIYADTAPLSNLTMRSPEETNGYSASWTVPFASRVYIEKLHCEAGSPTSDDHERVRILVNDRVVPLPLCGSDTNGMCGLGAFVNSLSFARAGGKWEECFK